MEKADTTRLIIEGLVFNEPAKKSRWLFVVYLVQPLLVLGAFAGVTKVVDGEVNTILLLALLPVYSTSVLRYWVSHGFPQVVIEKEGLRVRNRLVRFDQIRSITAQKNGTDYAVVTFGVYGAEGQLTLLARQEWSHPAFRTLIAELAVKAGVELDLVRDAPAKKVRLPKQARLASA
jgi:hypothetical protein